MKKNTARVIVTDKCSRDCSYCVNKQRGGSMFWNAHPLTDVQKLLDFEMILITGGEPLLVYDRVISLLIEIRAREEDIPVILYASRNLIDYPTWHRLFKFIDGVTWTVHDEKDDLVHERDKQDLIDFQMNARIYTDKSFRLNLAPSLVDIYPIIPMVWDQIKIKTWLGDCPLPDNETLFILPEVRK